MRTRAHATPPTAGLAAITRVVLTTFISVALSFGLGGVILSDKADAATAYVATGSVNVRSGPGTTHTILGVLATGDAVTGDAPTDGWVKVTYKNATGYVSAKYLRAASDPELPAVKYNAKTTATLAMRQAPEIGAASNGNLAKGSTVALTGTHSGSYSQIVRQGRVAWVLTGYLTIVGNGPALPRASGKRYVKVDEVNIRTTSAADSKVVGSATYGMVLSATGKTANKRTQVIFNGAARWAYTAYLTKTRPTGTAPPADEDDLGSTSLNRTNAYVKAIVRLIRAEFPEIKTMYGWRASSNYSSDHPGGRALDIMIPKYSTASGKALGDRIARYLQDDHKNLHIHYLIWRQRSWNVERNTAVTAWKKMADRGGATANHYDHVHVSVYA